MKVIHTYVPLGFSDPGSHSHILSKTLIYSQLLSALLAKREFGNIHLYTNEKIKKQITDIGIPYDTINTKTLEGEDPKTYSYYKMKVFAEQMDPFLHIDTDTFIYKKLFFEDHKNKILFAHPDHPIGENITRDSLNQISRSYSGLFFVLESQHKKSDVKNFDLNKIPNMCIVYGGDPKLFSEATKKSIKHYKKNRKLIDSVTYGACYIEQLMIHLNLLDLSSDYKKISDSGENFLSPNVFLFLDDMGEKFPFEMNLTTIKDYFFRETKGFKHISSSTHKNIHKIIVPNEESTTDFFDFDFFGVHHVTYFKSLPFFQCVCIGQIVNNFGEEWIKRVYHYYKKLNPINYEMADLTPGELLYEKLTGFQFNKPTTLI